MGTHGNQRTSVSALMGAPVLDAGGKAFGRVREFAVAPQEDASRVQALLVRRSSAGRRDHPSFVPINTLRRNADGNLQLLEAAAPAELDRICKTGTEATCRWAETVWKYRSARDPLLAAVRWPAR